MLKIFLGRCQAQWAWLCYVPHRSKDTIRPYSTFDYFSLYVFFSFNLVFLWKNGGVKLSVHGGAMHLKDYIQRYYKTYSIFDYFSLYVFFSSNIFLLWKNNVRNKSSLGGVKLSVHGGAMYLIDYIQRWYKTL